MKIGILAQYYPPTDNACANRMAAMATGLARHGHAITVITGMPNYPTGIKPPRYRFHLFARETIAGISVVRTYEVATSNSGLVRRSMNYLSFMVSACFALFMIPKLDVLIVSTPPLFVTPAARWIRCLRARRLIVDVRDVWPRSLYEIGHADRNALSIRILERMERKAYRRADALTAATDGIRNYLTAYQQENEAAPTPVHFLPNGIPDTLTAEPSDIRPDPDTFTLLYAGNHSYAQDLMQFLDFARALEAESDPRLGTVRFLFVGDGEVRPEMLESASNQQLNNVRFEGWIPREQTYDIIQKCALCIVSLKDTPLFRGALPSKTLESMYFERPILTNVAGELRAVLDAANCGYFFEPHDYASFRAAVLNAMTDENEYRRRCANAREHVLAHYRRTPLMDDLNARVVALADGSPEETGA